MMMLTNDHDNQDDQDNNAIVIKMMAMIMMVTTTLTKLRFPFGHLGIFMLMMVMTDDYNDKQNDEHTNYHGDHDDDHHHSDQTEVPMWPGGDSPCFNCGTAVKSSRALYLRELYLDTPYLREHGHHHHYQQLS